MQKEREENKQREWMSRVAIRSVRMGTYLGLDGRNITSFTHSGSGRAFPQTFIGQWEVFRTHSLGDGVTAFESAHFPGVYLRLAPGDVGQGSLVMPGGGKVNAQYGCFANEKFRMRMADGEKGARRIVWIESNHCPGRYLRMGNNVNVQGIMGVLEEFQIIPIV